MLKELIRKLIQKYYHITTSRNKNKTILFIHYNFTLSFVIKNALKNKCKVLFLPNYNLKDYTFNWRNINFTDEFRWKIIKTKERLKKYLISNNVDYVVIDRLTRYNLYFHCLILASKEIDAVRIIYLEHGETGTEHILEDYDRIINYDYFYATTHYTYSHFLNLKEKYNSDIKIRLWCLPRKKIKNKRKNFLLYVPSFTDGDRFVHNYSDILKYKHQLQILSILNDLSKNIRIKIVWKEPKGFTEGFSPIKSIIKKQYKNIIYSNKSYNNWLKKASAVITDTISTTFYDAINANVPVFCLKYKNSVRFKEGVTKLLESNIFLFERIEEDDIYKRIEMFINSAFMYNFNNEAKINNFNDKFPWE